MNRKSLRAIAATMLAFAVAMLGLLAGSGSANAAPIINPDAKGSLTIHKYLGTPTGATNDGS